MDAQLLRGESTPNHGKRLPRWAVAALSSAATIAAYQAFATPLSEAPQSSQLFSLVSPRWHLPNGEKSLRQALENIENQANNQSAAIEQLQAVATPACHPLHGQEFNVYVQGYDNHHGYSGELGKWLSFNNDGHWMIARYTQQSDAAPLHFRGFEDECNAYYLQNKYDNDDRWFSFTDCGKWIRATYQYDSAMPIKFIDQGDGLYRMKSVYAGQESYFAYTDSDDYECQYEHPARSLRLGYTAQEGMTVSLHSP